MDKVRLEDRALVQENLALLLFTGNKEGKNICVRKAERSSYRTTGSLIMGVNHWEWSVRFGILCLGSVSFESPSLSKTLVGWSLIEQVIYGFEYGLGYSSLTELLAC